MKMKKSKIKKLLKKAKKEIELKNQRISELEDEIHILMQSEDGHTKVRFERSDGTLLCVKDIKLGQHSILDKVKLDRNRILDDSVTYVAKYWREEDD